jgi:hypothetical protein
VGFLPGCWLGLIISSCWFEVWLGVCLFMGFLGDESESDSNNKATLSSGWLAKTYRRCIDILVNLCNCLTKTISVVHQLSGKTIEKLAKPYGLMDTVDF